MPKPMGTNQILLLQTLDRPSLHRERGVWFPWCGWAWGTTCNTNRLLQTLEKRGLVSSSPSERPNEYPTYRLTPEGEAIILQLKAANWRQA